jgi:hypothetical protein
MPDEAPVMSATRCVDAATYGRLGQQIPIDTDGRRLGEAEREGFDEVESTSACPTGWASARA